MAPPHLWVAMLEWQSNLQLAECRHLRLRRSDIHCVFTRQLSLAAVDVKECASDTIREADLRDTQRVGCDYDMYLDLDHSQTRWNICLWGQKAARGFKALRGWLREKGKLNDRLGDAIGWKSFRVSGWIRFVSMKTAKASIMAI